MSQIKNSSQTIHKHLIKEFNKNWDGTPCWQTDGALSQSWERLCNRTNLIDFTFHDLKHEAISRMFEKGLNIPEVASISGHKTASQLFRYVQVNI